MIFDILNNLSYNKDVEELDDVWRKDYNPYLMNRGFSYFPDTVLQANAMNLRSYLNKDAQFKYYYHSIRRRKRYSKWHKKGAGDLISVLSKILECSPKEAEKYLDILPSEQVEELKHVYGGTTKNSK